MTKVLIKILVFACVCFNLHAEPYVDFIKLTEDNGQRILRVEVKNPDVKPVTYEMSLFVNDTPGEWRKVKTFVLSVVGDGRESLFLDLLKLLAPHYNNAQQIKVECTLIFHDKNGIPQTTDTCSREYKLK